MLPNCLFLVPSRQALNLIACLLCSMMHLKNEKNFEVFSLNTMILKCFSLRGIDLIASKTDPFATLLKYLSNSLICYGCPKLLSKTNNHKTLKESYIYTKQILSYISKDLPVLKFHIFI